MNIWFFNHYAVPTSLYPLARPYHFANHLQQKGHQGDHLCSKLGSSVRQEPDHRWQTDESKTGGWYPLCIFESQKL